MANETEINQLTSEVAGLKTAAQAILDNAGGAAAANAEAAAAAKQAAEDANAAAQTVATAFGGVSTLDTIRDQTIAAAARTYDTLAALLADTAVYPVGTRLSVRGGGTYQRVASGGDLQRGDGVQVQLALIGTISLEALGAVGDGTTDDSAAFAKAVSLRDRAGTNIVVTGTLGKVYCLHSTIAVAKNGVKFDMMGASIKTVGNIAAFEFGEPAGSSANTYRFSGITNVEFLGSGAGNANNHAIVVSNHSYGSFSNNLYTNFGAKPIFVRAYGRGVQYNDFRNSEIKANFDGAIVLDAGTQAGGYITDNLFDNTRSHENPKYGGGGVTQVLLTGSGEMSGNRFNNCGFETIDPLDTILDIQNGSSNSFWPIRLDGDSASIACRIASGCNANWFLCLGTQGLFDDDSNTTVHFGDRGALDLPFMQFGTSENPATSTAPAFFLGIQQPGSIREFHIDSIAGNGPVRYPGETRLWLGDRSGGDNAPVEINRSLINLRTLPGTAIGSGPTLKFDGEFSASGNQGSVIVKQSSNGLDVNVAANKMLHSNGAISINSSVTAPAAVSGRAILFVDSSDGDLKVRFPNGTVKTIATDT